MSTVQSVSRKAPRDTLPPLSAAETPKASSSSPRGNEVMLDLLAKGLASRVADLLRQTELFRNAAKWMEAIVTNALDWIGAAYDTFEKIVPLGEGLKNEVSLHLLSSIFSLP